MAPAVAGVIGAVVTLVSVGLIAVMGFFLCGLRKRGAHKSSIGGFKGDGKLASDADISFRNPIWSTSKTASTAQQDDSATRGVIVRGHERLGSWEMGQSRKEVNDSLSMEHGRTSAWEDEVEEEWRQHSGLQPVKVRESV